MKKKTYLFALMAMALTLGSCSDNENGIGGETSKYITVSTSIGNMTRVATDEKGGQTFEEGDEISVYAWTRCSNCSSRDKRACGEQRYQQVD